jgi:hypothetical protein
MRLGDTYHCPDFETGQTERDMLSLFSEVNRMYLLLSCSSKNGVSWSETTLRDEAIAFLKAKPGKDSLGDTLTERRWAILRQKGRPQKDLTTD